MRSISGGCLCGKVRYATHADPVIVAVRDWRNAQQQAGTTISVVVGVPKSSVSIEGQLKTFHDRGDSGQPVNRNFCPECGSPILSEIAVMPQLSIIKAGTLDDTSWLDPIMHVYCDSAENWVHIP